MKHTKDKLFPFVDFYSDLLVSEDGNLFVFFDCSFNDKCTLTKDIMLNISANMKKAIEVFGDSFVFYQYLIKYKGNSLSINPTEDKESNKFIHEHIEHIKSQGFYLNKCFFVIEYKCNLAKDNSDYLALFKSILKFNFSSLNEDYYINIVKDDIKKHALHFNELIVAFKARLQSFNKLYRIETLNNQMVVNFLSFLATFNVDYLCGKDVVSDNNVQACINLGDINKASYKGLSLLNCGDYNNTNIAIGSVNRFVGSVKPDFLATTNNHIIDTVGNFMLFSSFNIYSDAKKALVFKSAKNKQESITLNPLKTLFSSKSNELIIAENKNVSKKLEELNDAKYMNVSWGTCCYGVVVFDDDVTNLVKVKNDIHGRIESADAKISWESFGILKAYNSLLPSGHNGSARKLKMNSHQYACLSFLYTGHSGQSRIENISHDEPICYYKGRDGILFGLSLSVGKKSVAISDGETRGGKSFHKDHVNAMMQRLRPSLAFLDIDKGSYKLADNFKNSKIFEMPKYAYNPFNDYIKGVNDTQFIKFLSGLLQLMSNNTLNDDEIESIESFTSIVCKMRKEMHTVKTLFSTLSNDIKIKFNDYIVGTYKDFFSNEVYELSNLNCFNLEHISEIKELQNIAYYCLIFQIVTNFRHRCEASQLKYLTVDESHVPLKIPEFIDYLDLGSRTGNKRLFGFWLMSQSAYEFSKLPFWEALRTSVSTLFFFPNSQLNEELYKKTYSLTDGEIDAIKGLIPRKEFLIIQREIGVSKVLVFEPDDFFLNKFTLNLNSNEVYNV